MLLIIEAEAADSPDVLPGQRCKQLLHILTSFSMFLRRLCSTTSYSYALGDLMLSPWCTLDDLGLGHSCQVVGSRWYKCISVIRLAIFCKEANESLLVIDISDGRLRQGVSTH